ncbi:adenine deaminase [Methanobrevibacter filiformis]|uniref:adenine deaminase n=1 Tax=Methanobrevibacter filiformis TaxID=55758 RepID=UPI00373FD407
MTFIGNILDLEINEIYPAKLVIENSYFKEITPLNPRDRYELDLEGIIVPGFIDSHIHIESTMLTPSYFAETVVPFGTTSVIADPHEIANVMGIEGIDFMIKDGSEVPFDFYYTAPSCVPATDFETSGAVIDSMDIKELMKNDEIIGLGEVMNYVGVINKDEKIIAKLNVAKSFNKPIDGHAPLLTGEDLKRYIDFEDIDGPICITDHECVSFDEAIEKKALGMKIMVREGSSAKNMEALFNLNDRIKMFKNQDFFGAISVLEFEKLMKHPIFDFLVSDDKKPDDLIKGHINLLLKKAIYLGIDPIEAIKMVSLNPANHYNLNSGLIAEGKIANFLLIDNFEDFNIKKTYIHGNLVAENGKSLFSGKKQKVVNNFKLTSKKSSDFDIDVRNINDNMNNIDNFNEYDGMNSKINKGKIATKIIEAVNGEIITNSISFNLAIKNNVVQPNVKEDILKLAVVERYGKNNIANAFIKGFNLKEGAVASSVMHDSHNIIVLGTNSDDMAKAVNLIGKNKGGIAIVSNSYEKILPLPIAGVMTGENIEKTVNLFNELQSKVKSLGCTLDSPFMTLSFMGLLVIPNLKLSDKGLFDSLNFKFTNLFI